MQAISTGKQRNAVSVIQRVRPDYKTGGVPWMVVLDAQGERLITGDGPEGNCGFPYKPHEIAWFRTMLEKTSERLGDSEIDAIVAANEAFVEKLEKKAREKAKGRGGK